MGDLDSFAVMILAANDEEQKKILGRYCYKTQLHILNIIKAETDTNNKQNELLRRDIARLSERVNHSSGAISSIYMAAETIEKGNIELKTSNMMLEQRKVKLAQSQIEMVKKYRSTWQLYQRQYETAPLPRKLAAEKLKLKELARLKLEYQVKEQDLIDSLALFREIGKKSEQQLIIDFADLMVSRPALEKQLGELWQRVRVLKAEVEEMEKNNKTIASKVSGIQNLPPIKKTFDDFEELDLPSLTSYKDEYQHGSFKFELPKAVFDSNKRPFCTGKTYETVKQLDLKPVASNQASKKPRVEPENCDYYTSPFFKYNRNLKKDNIQMSDNEEREMGQKMNRVNLNDVPADVNEVQKDVEVLKSAKEIVLNYGSVKSYDSTKCEKQKKHIVILEDVRMDADETNSILRNVDRNVLQPTTVIGFKSSEIDLDENAKSVPEMSTEDKVTEEKDVDQILTSSSQFKNNLEMEQPAKWVPFDTSTLENSNTNVMSMTQTLTPCRPHTEGISSQTSLLNETANCLGGDPISTTDQEIQSHNETRNRLLKQYGIASRLTVSNPEQGRPGVVQQTLEVQEKEHQQSQNSEENNVEIDHGTKQDDEQSQSQTNMMTSRNMGFNLMFQNGLGNLSLDMSADSTGMDDTENDFSKHLGALATFLSPTKPEEIDDAPSDQPEPFPFGGQRKLNYNIFGGGDMNSEKCENQEPKSDTFNFDFQMKKKNTFFSIFDKWNSDEAK